MKQTRYHLGSLLGDWRFLLAIAMLFGLLWWETVGNMPNTFSYSAFMRVHSQVGLGLEKMGESLGVDGSYDRVEDLWEAFVDDPIVAQYYYLSTLCNLVFAPLAVNALLSIWIIGQGIRGRSVSAMLLRGASRTGVFLRLLLPYLLLALLLRWGVAFCCFRFFPIRWGYFPPDYRGWTLRFWLLFTAAEACLSGFIAFAVGPLAAVGLNLSQIPLLLVLRPVRRLIPMSALGDKELWKPGSDPAALIPAAVVAAVLILASLLGSWLVFRKKDLR